MAGFLASASTLPSSSKTVEPPRGLGVIGQDPANDDVERHITTGDFECMLQDQRFASVIMTGVFDKFVPK